MSTNDIINYINNSKVELDADVDLTLPTSSLPLTNIMVEKTLNECNSCKTELKTGYHCDTCKHFYQCNDCFKSNAEHEHKLDVLAEPEPEQENTSADTTTQTPEQLNESLKKKNESLLDTCLKALNHVVSCHESNCRFEKCLTIKRVITHANNCQRLKNGTQCNLCRQLISLCIYHAKSCQEEICKIPHCLPIKCKLSKIEELKVKLQSITEFILANLTLLKFKTKSDFGSQTGECLPQIEIDKTDIEQEETRAQIEMETSRVLFLEKIEKIKSTPTIVLSSREEKALKFEKKLRGQLTKILFDSLVQTFGLKSKKFNEDVNFALLVVLFIKSEKELYAKTNNSDDYLCLITELVHNLEIQFRKKLNFANRVDAEIQTDGEERTINRKNGLCKDEDDLDGDSDIPARKRVKFE